MASEEAGLQCAWQVVQSPCNHPLSHTQTHIHTHAYIHDARTPTTPLHHLPRPTPTSSPTHPPLPAQRERLQRQLEEAEGKLREARADRKEDERDRRKAQVVEDLRRQIPGGFKVQTVWCRGEAGGPSHVLLGHASWPGVPVPRPAGGGGPTHVLLPSAEGAPAHPASCKKHVGALFIPLHHAHVLPCTQRAPFTPHLPPPTTPPSARPPHVQACMAA